MTLAILVPTVWEIRCFIKVFELKKKSDFFFEYRRGNLNVILQLCGVGRKNALRHAEALAAGFNPISLMVLTGFAGALKEELHPGDLVLDPAKNDPENVEKLSKIAQREAIPAHIGKFVTVDKALMSPEEKARTGGETGAAAVEMESEAVYQFCLKKNIPFCTFRTVCDGVSQNLPERVMQLGSDGKVGFKFILNLLMHPGDWLDFFRLAGSARRAESNLSKILLGYIRELEKNGKK